MKNINDDQNFDYVIDHAARPPVQKVKALHKNDTKDFWRTWVHKRTDFQSISEYELALANLMALADWTDQEIVDALIWFRQRYGEIEDGVDHREPKGRSAYDNTLTKASAYAEKHKPTKQAVVDVSLIAQRPRPRKPSAPEQLIRIAEEKCTEFFMDERNQPYVRIPRGSHLEIWPAKHKRFRTWLAGEFRAKNDTPPASTALSMAILGVESICFDSPSRDLHNRVARHKGAIWYDLSNDDWQAVKITADGWKVIDDPPPLFCRYAHQQPQVMPVKGGRVADILPFVNLPVDKHLRLLIEVFLVSCLVPEIPHPILNMGGPQGSAKSHFLRIIRAVVDPSIIPTLSPPKNSQEVTLQLFHNWFAPFDNITSFPDWFSNILCRAATGAGHSQRELYTNEEEILFHYKRVVAINGIINPATRPDFLDRCIIINLEFISDVKRMTERILDDDWANALPGILGACFDALSHALSIFPPSLSALPRMADFAEWGFCIAEGLGYTGQEFLDAYQTNIGDLHLLALEYQPFARAVIDVAREAGPTGWEGSATQLLEAAKKAAAKADPPIDTKQEGWPKNARWTSTRLTEAIVNLKSQGIKVIQTERREIFLSLESSS